jgi:hypothetical protein
LPEANIRSTSEQEEQMIEGVKQTVTNDPKHLARLLSLAWDIALPLAEDGVSRNGSFGTTIQHVRQQRESLMKRLNNFGEVIFLDRLCSELNIAFWTIRDLAEGSRCLLTILPALEIGGAPDCPESLKFSLTVRVKSDHQVRGVQLTVETNRRRRRRDELAKAIARIASRKKSRSDKFEPLRFSLTYSEL